MRSLIFAVFSAALCPSALALLLKALSQALSDCSRPAPRAVPSNLRHGVPRIIR